MSNQPPPPICNSHGDQQVDYCFCDAGWYGIECMENFKTGWHDAYYIYLGFFLASFFIVATICIRQLLLHMQDKQYFNFHAWCSFICVILQSPLNVEIALCLLFCVIKMIWLAVDPFQFNGILNRVYERILSEVVYSILFAIYGIMLIVLYTIYDEVSFNTNVQKKRRFICGYYKQFMKFRIVMVFIIQIAASIAKGLRQENRFRYFIYAAYAVLSFNFVYIPLILTPFRIFIIEFALYGSRLFLCIDEQLKQNAQSYKTRKDIVQNDQIVVLVAANLPKPKKEPKMSIQVDIVLQQFNQSSQKTIISQGMESSQQQKHESNIFSYPREPEIVFLTEPHMLSKSQQYFSRSFSKPTDQMRFRQKSFSKQKMAMINSPNNQQSMENMLETSSIHVEENDNETEWVNTNLKINPATDIVRRQVRIIKNLRDTKDKMPQKLQSLGERQQFNRQDNQIDEVQDNDKQMVQEEAKNQVQVQFYNKREHLQLDIKVLQQIMLLVLSGVILEVCFAILTLIIYSTTREQTATGVLITLFIVGVLELLSLTLVIKLFQDIQSKEIENLIWIKKLGQKTNAVNQKFQFKIPQNLKLDDEQKQRFENRINQN